MREARLITQFQVSAPATLFLTDLNGDGKPEFLWAQTRGCMDAYGKHANREWCESQRSEVFHLAATTTEGEPLWEVGRAVPPEEPYISHFADGFVCTGGHQGKGHLLALKPLGKAHALIAVERETGRVTREKRLPRNDWFWILKAQTRGGEFLAVDNGDMGYYRPNPTGNFTLFLDQNWDEVHLTSACGGGHWPACFDADGDGDEEFLIGYDLFRADGHLEWRLERWREETIKPFEQHVDQHVIVRSPEGDWLGVTAGSDTLYLVGCDGSVLWQRTGPHVQFCQVGRFLEGDERTLIFLLNSRIQQNLYDLEGNELWRGHLPENWPGGRPEPLAAKPRMHMGRPMSVWHDPMGTGQDLIVYNEAGWPTGIDGRGRVCVTFPFPEDARQPDEFRIPGWPQFDGKPPVRPDDWGFGYRVEIADLDADSREEVVIHDRRWCWVYRI